MKINFNIVIGLMSLALLTACPQGFQPSTSTDFAGIQSIAPQDTDFPTDDDGVIIPPDNSNDSGNEPNEPDEPPVTPPPTNAYDYEFKPTHYPRSASEIKVWHINSTGGTVPAGDWSQYLLIVLPNEPMTGPIQMSEGKYKGIFMIGGKYMKRGSVLKIPSSRSDNQGVLGEHIFKIQFAADGNFRPYLFVANLDFSVGDSYWGDMFRIGTKFKTNNQHEHMDTYVQKTKIRSGHYFFSSKPETPTSDTDVPHSDFYQGALGGWKGLYLANADIKWGGQTVFCVPNTYTTHPEGQCNLKNVMFRAMPVSTYVYGPNGGTRPIKYISQAATSHPGYDAVNGKYYSVSTQNVYAELRDVQPDKASYFNIDSLVSKSISGNKYLVSYWKHILHAFGIVEGDRSVTFSEPLAPVVEEDEIGLDLRITSAAQLMQLINDHF